MDFYTLKCQAALNKLRKFPHGESAENYPNICHYLPLVAPTAS